MRADKRIKRDTVKIRVCDEIIVEYNPLYKFNPKRGPRVALFYPAPYKVAVQSLGYQMLYAYLISYGIRVERFTYDSCGRSLETGTPLNKFDTILVSASFELDYLYMSEYLRTFASKGSRIVVGGLAPTANPIPVLDIADAVVLGDAEPVIEDLADALSASDWESFFSKDHVVTPEDESGKKVVADLVSSPALAKQFVPLNVEPPWGRGFLVEVTRGCPWKCRFCLEGWVSKPFRQREIAQLRSVIESVDKPFDKIITISLSLGNYHHVKEYLDLLFKKRKEGITGSVPSLRLETLTEDLVELIREIGQKTVTLAPETFVPQKAAVLGKGYSPKIFKEKVELIKKYGLKLKVYMMMLPGEKEETIKEDVEILKQIGKQVHVSVNPLIPKPWTPLHAAPVPTKREEVLAKIYKENFKYVEVYPVKWARLQAALGLAEKPLASSLRPFPPEMLLREMNEKGLVSVKRLENWREFEAPWMRFEVSDPLELTLLAERSKEAWEELHRRR